ncbi:5651_t:CDS:2 [Entrophospora sp. SA101]|nr:5651_t:CDS:2 [Entrophospora sp. SA101]CAJ0830055.1 299_t:CDS:2 [Entrophospora sp. SA101]
MPNNFESTPLHDKSCNILFDKLKFGLAYIILQNKPIENSIEEDYKDHKIKEVTTINSHDVKLRKRILELENDCENLKQKLCLMELELNSIKQSINSSKRRKSTIIETRGDQMNSIININDLSNKSATTINTVDNGSQDFDCNLFLKLPFNGDKDDCN